MEINPSEYKILVVDDVTSNILLMKVLLTKEKFNIISANSGKACLDIVSKEHPDLILLDVMMPEMDGYETAERLKANSETKEIPIIFLTALNTTANIVQGFKSGGNDFISKPFNKEELIIRIMHQLSLVAANKIIVAKTDELIKTINSRDKLYSVIAHDLRSPLGSVKIVLNMLMLSLSKEKIGEDMYDLLTTANKTTEETFVLLDNLLKWTKSQIGKLNMVLQNMDMTELIESIVEIYSVTARVKKINIEVQLPEKVDVCMDIDMIKTVLRNFLSNAIKFSNYNSTIRVILEDQDKFVKLSVQDHGTGIKEEDQPKLFRVDKHFTTFGTANEEGSGLGLLLCQDFINKHNGKIGFDSEYGKGSTFYFILPKQQQAKDLGNK
jgi:two-component system, sensor histidine kinase and response regulator